MQQDSTYAPSENKTQSKNEDARLLQGGGGMGAESGRPGKVPKLGLEDWPFVSWQGLQGRQRWGRRVSMAARGVGQAGRGGGGRGQGGRGRGRRGVVRGGVSLGRVDEGGMDVEESDTERRGHQGGKKRETQSGGAESQRAMGMYDLLAALTGPLGQP